MIYLIPFGKVYVLIITLIFDTKIAVVSLLMMSFSDPCASLFGQCFGQVQLSTKTLEGSIVFFIVSTVSPGFANINIDFTIMPEILSFFII